MPRGIAVDYKASLNFGAAGATTNIMTYTASSAMSAANTATFTVAAWLKVRGIGGGSAGRIIDGAPWVFLTGTSPGGWAASGQAAHSTTTAIASSNRLFFNQWYRVLYTWSDADTTPNIYINGVLDNAVLTPKSGTRLTTSATQSIGNRSDLIRNFNGQIGDLCIWNRVLTSTEITQDAIGSTPTSGLISRKSMGDGANSAVDSIDPSLNGTISGATFTSDTPSKARSQVGGNLVQNGSFEYAPPLTAVQTSGQGNWIDGTSGGSASNNLFSWGLPLRTGTTSTQYDQTTSHSGTTSLKLSILATASGLNAANTSALTLASIAPNAARVNPNTSYTLTYWMKTTYTSGASSNGAYASISERAGDGTQVLQTDGTKITATTGWTQYSVTVTTGATTRYVIIKLINDGSTGTATLIQDAWFDDITLTETVPVGRGGVQDFKSSLSFNGSNTSISYAATTVSKANAPSCSFAVWINARSAGGGSLGRIVDNGRITALMQTTSGNLYVNGQIIHSTTAAASSCQAGTIIKGKWHRVCMTWNPGNNRPNLYIDGRLSNTGTGVDKVGTESDIGATGYIGNWSAGTRAFDGTMAQLQFWNKELSAAEVAADYAASLGISNIVGNYMLGEGAGTTAIDSSGSGNNGTITAGTFSADVPSRKRQYVGGNMVQNGSCEYVPPFTAGTNVAGKYADGTASGSTTNTLFGSWGTLAAAVVASANLSFDTTVSSSGLASIRLNCPGTSSSIVAGQGISGSSPATTDIVSVLPSTSYTLSAWVKTNNVGTNGVYLDLREYSGLLNTVLTTSTTKFSGTNNWTQISLTVTTNATTRFIQILLRNSVPGNISDAWFDDITLTPTANITRQLVS